MGIASRNLPFPWRGFKPLGLSKRRSSDWIRNASMATGPAEWKRAKQFKIDGVTYDICVVRKGEQYKSAWVCTRCIEQGPSEQSWSTREEAADRAEIGSRIHHAFVHGGLSRVMNSNTGMESLEQTPGRQAIDMKVE
jgi:hypothetical protein